MFTRKKTWSPDPNQGEYTVRLKADLHLHTGDDPLDYITYSNKEMIDHAAELGFEILAITNHDFMSHRAELADYADSRGVVLVPGVEATIENRHVLLYNFDYWERPPHTFADLYRLGRTLVGTSDAHFLWQMGVTYSYIDVKERSVTAVLDAIREGWVDVATRPLPMVDVLFRIRQYPSLKLRRLAQRNGYRREILRLH
jgi:hypothetical protein